MKTQRFEVLSPTNISLIPNDLPKARHPAHGDLIEAARSHLASITPGVSEPQQENRLPAETGSIQLLTEQMATSADNCP
jgi:hypothetical protein